MSRMPTTYRPPNGGPLRWQDDTSNVLPRAVWEYLTSRRCSDAALELVRDYCEYYINAPCWDANPYHDNQTRAQLSILRADIREVTTAGALNLWLHRCLQEGIDPL